VQLGRGGGGKSKANPKVISAQWDHSSCARQDTQGRLNQVVYHTLQDELERQEKYPNLVEPHRLKALLVGVPQDCESGAKFEAAVAVQQQQRHLGKQRRTCHTESMLFYAGRRM
jgi:hypothetical protein